MRNPRLLERSEQEIRQADKYDHLALKAYGFPLKLNEVLRKSDGGLKVLPLTGPKNPVLSALVRLENVLIERSFYSL